MTTFPDPSLDALAPADPTGPGGEALGGERRPSGRYNSGLRYAPASTLGGGSDTTTRLVGPSYRGNQNTFSNNEAYWAVRYDEYLWADAPHKDVSELPMERVPRGQTAGIDFTKDWVEIGLDPLTMVLPPWEISQCPEARYMAINYRLGLPFEPFGKYSSYCFNGRIPGRINGGTGPLQHPLVFFARGYLPRRLSAIEFNVIMFQDGSEPFLEGNGDMLNELTQGRPEDDADVWIPEYFRHTGVCNVAYLDGSVSDFNAQFPEIGYTPYAGYDRLAEEGSSGYFRR